VSRDRSSVVFDPTLAVALALACFGRSGVLPTINLIAATVNPVARTVNPTDAKYLDAA